MMSPHPGRTCVYRFRDNAGRLLYIGITNSPQRRFLQHANDKPWWHAVEPELTVIDWYATRNQALREEERAIKSERPMYNVIHSSWYAGPHQGERPTDDRDHVVKPLIVSLLGACVLVGPWIGWFSAPGEAQVVGAIAMIAAGQLAWRRALS